MVMKRCCVVGRVFGEESETNIQDFSIVTNILYCSLVIKQESDFQDKKLLYIISDDKRSDIQDHVSEFFHVLTVCNAVLPEKREDGSNYLR